MQNNVPAGNNKAASLFVADGNGMDLADVDAGAYPGLRLGFRVLGGVAEEIPSLPPKDLTGVHFCRRDKPGVEPDPGGEGEDQGAGFSSSDRHLLEGSG